MKHLVLALLGITLICNSCNDNDFTLEKTVQSSNNLDSLTTRALGETLSCNILTNTGDILDNNGQIVVTLTPNLANYEKYNYLSNIKIECEDLNHAGHSYILEDIYGGVAIYPNTPLRRTIKITRPGFYKVKATMKFHKGFSTVTSNSATFSLACPDANRIQAILEPQFRAMWAQTLSTTREHGFYIYLIDGKNIRAGEVCISEPYTGEEVIGNYITGSESSPKANPTYTGVQYIIGIFHTHPPLSRMPINYSRIPGPSAIDLRDKLDYPGFVYDYTRRIQGGHDLNLPAKVYQYGPTKRNI